MRKLLKRLVREEQGQDVIEYALLAAGISVAVVPMVPLIGDTLQGLYTAINTALPTGVNP